MPPILLLLLAAVGTYYGVAIWRGRAIAPKILLIAHRGGPASQPENTLAAFRQAIADGVDWLECDVQMTADGELVVFHDESVERSTDGEGAVAALTLPEIQSLDAGSGERVPKFTEVIELAKEAGLGLLAEVKSPHLYPGIEAAMAEAIVEADYVEGAMVQCFDGGALERFRETYPDLERCALYGLWQFRTSGPQPGEAKYVCPMAEMVLLNPYIVERAHADGLQVFVWFGLIESPLSARAMLLFGVDGLIVDNQQAIKRVMPG